MQGTIEKIAPRTKPLILAVDDESVVCTMLKDILEYSAQHNVITCHDATQALDFVADCSPDLVLLDIRMPGMSGAEVLDRILWYDPELPVIMVTAVDDFSIALESMKHGAVDYIVKPFNMDLITTAVGNALANRNMANRDRARQIQTEDKLLEQWASLEQQKRQLSTLNSMYQGRVSQREEIVHAYDELATRVEDLAHRLRSFVEGAKREISQG